MAGISQAVVSYYETGRATPSPETAGRLAKALNLPTSDLTHAINEPEREHQPVTRDAELPRDSFLKTLRTLPGRVATLDQPAGEDGGDLAFAVDLRSHVFLVVLDAQGSGPTSAPFARLAAATAFGATIVPGGGLPTPEDIVDATIRFWRFVEVPVSSSAICVVCFDRQGRRIRQCRLGMPPPFLRSGRLAQWTGKPDGPAGAFVGETELGADGLLLVATDGIAHISTKGERPLWDAPEVRTMLARATDPSQVVDMLTRRAGLPIGAQRVDDRFAIAVMPW